MINLSVRSALITLINTRLSPLRASQATRALNLHLSLSAHVNNIEPSETDYERNQIQFHAVPYTGPADDIGRLINFLMATYQQYGALMPENVKRKD